MAHSTLSVLTHPNFPQVFAAATDRLVARVDSIAKPFSVTTAYQQLVVKHLRLLDSAYAAVAYLNLGEVEKAQNVLQGTISDIG